MVSTRRSVKACQNGVPLSDNGADYRPEEGGSGPVTARALRLESRTLRKATLTQKGKQPKRRRNKGKLSKLLDMPLDVLYEVSYRVVPSPKAG